MKSVRNFLMAESGAVAIIYMIIFPILLVSVAFSFDSALALNRKSLLADAASEAILAISAIDNRQVSENDRSLNKAIGREYINFYLPHNDKDTLELKITMEDHLETKGFVDYGLTASVNLPTLLPLKKLGMASFNKTINIGNYTDNSGNARKFVATNYIPTDYVFVVDFSDTMNSADAEHSNKTLTRLDMLKKVVSEIVEGNKHSDSQFALVPFDLGVPFRVQDAVNSALHLNDPKNEAGGDLVGCSALYVPRTDFSPDKIDYMFWANKHIMQEEYKDFNTNKNPILYNMDRSRYLYYRFVVGQSLNESITDMQHRNWCVHNAQSGTQTGSYLFSCEKDPTQSIFASLNENKIIDQYNNVVNLVKTMRDSSTFERSSIFNSLTINYAATLEVSNLFSNDNVHEFIQPWAPNMYEYRAFTGMCQSATPLFTVSESLSQEEAEKGIARTLHSATPRTFLIPLTSSRAEKDKFVSTLTNMVAGGGTDSSVGLLRAIPVIAAGKNTKKVIIVISDGEDEADPKIVSKELHSRGVCDLIKSGLKSKSLYADNKIGVVAETVEIHYISINNNSSNAERLAFWGTYCAKGDSAADKTKYVHTASDFQSLLDTLKSIIGVETGYYIRDDQK